MNGQCGTSGTLFPNRTGGRHELGRLLLSVAYVYWGKGRGLRIEAIH